MSNTIDVNNIIVNEVLNVDGYVINPSYSEVGNFLAYDGHAYIPATAVTNIETDATLTGGPIETSGTLGINLTNANSWLAGQVFTTIATTHLLTTSSSLVTGTALSALGTTGSITLAPNFNKTDMAGTFYLVAGGTGVSSGQLATITFGTTYSTPPLVILFGINAVATGFGTANQHYYVDIDDTTATTFTVRATATPPTAVAIKFLYFVIGQ